LTANVADLGSLPEPLPVLDGPPPPRRCSPNCAELSAERALYLDSSAIVKLAVTEPESASFRRYLRRWEVLATSALARAEVARDLLPFGSIATQRGDVVLHRLEILQLCDRILREAGLLLPVGLHTLDAIHLASAQQMGTGLSRLITYDGRMTTAAADLGMSVVAPS
jgi:predicted nucleic acid-binding protein